MTMNILSLMTLKRWAKAAVLTVPVLVAQAMVPALQPYSDGALVGVVQAQEQAEAKKEKKKTKRTQAMNNKTYEKLQLAQEAVEAKNIPEAIAILDELKNNTRRPPNDAELANILNMYAFIYYSKEDYKNALESYKQIIPLPLAPEGTIVQARYSVAQLYFVMEEYREGIDALLEWFKVTAAPTASAYVMLAQGYYQIKDNDNALKNIEVAITMYKEKDKVPKEQWYGLQYFLYYDKKEIEKTVEILSEMIVHYPKKQYWMQLSGMYADLGNEARQTGSLEAAYVQGMLEKEKELINMASLYLMSDVPYKAAKVLDKGIDAEFIDATSKNLDLLGMSWRQAQEIKKAIPEMAKAAAKSDAGDLWARLCNVYLDNDQFKKAIDACDKGLKKGGVKRKDQAHLVKGMAHYELKQYKSARSEFIKASKDKRTAKMAKQWSTFMAKELERQKSLEST